jgi:hypothetical protein
MAQLTICDETFGGTESGRRVEHQLEIDLAEISAADLIRLRVEREFEARAAPAAIMPADLKAVVDHLPRAPLEKALAEARRGLETNAFFLIVNGRQIRELSEIVALDNVNSATFLKLVSLKGG